MCGTILLKYMGSEVRGVVCVDSSSGGGGAVSVWWLAHVRAGKRKVD